MPDWAVSAAIRAVEKFPDEFAKAAHGASALVVRCASIFKSMRGADLAAGTIRRIGRGVTRLPTQSERQPKCER